jgi:predicted O-linked N-acetylglucosamine transferase (SPINDLY family)
VQATYLGYPNTTGMMSIDCWITDAHVDPPGQTDKFCTEELYHLPHTLAVYRPPADSPDISDPPMLRSGAITFGSFNNLAKLTPQVIELWAQVLRATPKSRLLLQTHALRDEPTRQRFVEQFRSHGVAADQVEMRPSAAMRSYLQAYSDVDIVLDPFPFTGHTVSLHTLWMGVPIVTLAGDRHVARRGVSLLMNLGLPELIAKTHDEYVTIASRLAADPTRLSEWRRALRERIKSSSLMDETAFTRELESAYRSMWRSYCARRFADE